MATSVTYTVRTDKDVKNKAARVLSDLGLDIATAFNMMLRQVVITESIPFEIRKNYNVDTLQAMKDVNNRRNLSGPFKSMKALKESLDA